MKKIFYAGLILLALFEILNVYFIMPMPGSQRMNSLDIAYFFYRYRWYFRIVFALMILTGSFAAFQTERKWVPALALLPTLFIVYLFNFVMSADHMFKQPRNLSFKVLRENALNDSSIVVGVDINGETRAYPIRFITYHHQVQDIVGGKPVIVTYCSVCRTGRVFEPTVKGHAEKFRLVGMDHFNAMFEDATTKSWWRQATGEAVTGPLKGELLPEVESFQMTIGKLSELYPDAMVMQVDDASKSSYDSLAQYERGKSKGKLTRTDSLSWKDKSWVLGIQLGETSKAYDWNLLKEQQVINDNIGNQPIVIALSADGQSFAAFERPSAEAVFSIRNDTLQVNDQSYSLSGINLTRPDDRLQRVKVYQEFWHSWRTFHPQTITMPDGLDDKH